MRILAVLLMSSPLLAQAVSVGLRAGIPITPTLTADRHQQALAPRFIFGPLVEFHLWHGARFGAEFLLHRAGLAGSLAGTERVSVWQWEAPAAFLYRFCAPARPFVRTGISLHRVFDIGGATECGRGPSGEQFYCLGGSPFAELRHRGTFGFVAGGGLRFKFNRLWLEPEVRLTRRIDRNLGVRDSAVRSNLSQIGFLVGVIF